MGLLDSLLSTALGSTPANQQPSLVNMALGLIQNHPQGLQGLLDQFIQSGLAQHAQSWVGNGQNMPLSAEQLVQALGSGRLLPVHWGTFDLALHDWHQPAEVLLAQAPDAPGK